LVVLESAHRRLQGQVPAHMVGS
jgi:hypothetical protein